MFFFLLLKSPCLLPSLHNKNDVDSAIAMVNGVQNKIEQMMIDRKSVQKNEVPKIIAMSEHPKINMSDYKNLQNYRYNQKDYKMNYPKEEIIISKAVQKDKKVYNPQREIVKREVVQSQRQNRYNYNPPKKNIVQAPVIKRKVRVQKQVVQKEIIKPQIKEDTIPIVQRDFRNPYLNGFQKLDLDKRKEYFENRQNDINAAINKINLELQEMRQNRESNKKIF